MISAFSKWFSLFIVTIKCAQASLSPDSTANRDCRAIARRFKDDITSGNVLPVHDAIPDIDALVECATEAFNGEGNVIDLPDLPIGGKAHIVSDVHGELNKVKSAFRLGGDPDQNNVYIFNGDYVNGNYVAAQSGGDPLEGLNQATTLALLYSYKVLYPRFVILQRGNHDAPPVADDSVRNYGEKFIHELWRDYGKDLGQTYFDLFTSVFAYMPYASILESNTVLVSHSFYFDPRVPGCTLDSVRRLPYPAQTVVPPMRQIGDCGWALLWNYQPDMQRVEETPFKYFISGHLHAPKERTDDLTQGREHFQVIACDRCVSWDHRTGPMLDITKTGDAQEPLVLHSLPL